MSQHRSGSLCLYTPGASCKSSSRTAFQSVLSLIRCWSHSVQCPMLYTREMWGHSISKLGTEYFGAQQCNTVICTAPIGLLLEDTMCPFHVLPLSCTDSLSLLIRCLSTILSNINNSYVMVQLRIMTFFTWIFLWRTSYMWSCQVLFVHDHLNSAFQLLPPMKWG